MINMVKIMKRSIVTVLVGVLILTSVISFMPSIEIKAAPTPISIVYRVDFEKDGGTGGTDYINLTDTDNYSFPSNIDIPTKEGDTFLGYFLEENTIKYMMQMVNLLVIMHDLVV